MPVPTDINSLSTTPSANSPIGSTDSPSVLDDHQRQAYAHIATLRDTKANIASAALTGTPTAPTATAGTNNTQIATTAFAMAASFPSGTRIPFAQSSAPTGWTQDATDAADNRMLRVVKTAGAGIGGSHSPILNNVVPSHTHGFTTGNQSADHSHSGSTGVVSADHSHGIVLPFAWGSRRFDNTDGAGYGTDNGSSTFTSGGINANHTHEFTTGGVSSNHTHSGTSNENGSAANWTPRYIDLILCTKD